MVTKYSESGLLIKTCIEYICYNVNVSRCRVIQVIWLNGKQVRNLFPHACAAPATVSKCGRINQPL